MAIKTIITDDSNNELSCYLNDAGDVYMEIGQAGDDHHYTGFITLEKEDVQHLIKKLTELESEMDE